MADIKLSDNFSLYEFTDSSVAKAKKIDNIPDSTSINNIKILVSKVLQPVRIKFSKPINVTSGYRSKELNKELKGASSSQHLTGNAADITAGNKKLNKELWDTILLYGEYDQLIDEEDFKWIHVSYKNTGNRKQIIHL